MKGLSTLVLLLVSLLSHSQFNVHLELEDLSGVRRNEVYISGSFNNWDSTANPKYKLRRLENKWVIELDLPKGDYEYKYTGGGWSSVEKKWDYDEVQNHQLTVNRNLVIHDTVVEWRDVFIRSKREQLKIARADTVRLKIYASLASAYAFSPELYNTDSALFNIQQAMQLLQSIKFADPFRSKNEYSRWLIMIQQINASVLHALGNYTAALQLRLESLNLANGMQDYEKVVLETFNIMREYDAMKDYRNLLVYCRRMQPLLSKVNDYSRNTYREGLDYFLALSHFHLGEKDSAIYYAGRLVSRSPEKNYPIYTVTSYHLLGDIYSSLGKTDSALYAYRQSLRTGIPYSMFHVVGKSQLGIAAIYRKTGLLDSSLFYIRSAIAAVEKYQNTFRAWGENATAYMASISYQLADVYKDRNMPDSAYKYLHDYVGYTDSLNNLEMIRQFQNVTFNENFRQEQSSQQAKQDRQKLVSRIKIYSLIGGLLIALVLALVLYRNIREKQKANLELAKQKKDIEITLAELKQTQTQLVQSEKMASLGELTAGIAHEIQNPLNFVNNFSELNAELLDELVREVDKGDIESAKQLATDVRENEQKIAFHGRRAEGIVKGMLQHSRMGTGQKELTDINALADEYVRLAYHGLRAKDKTFNAEFKTSFDESIGKINVIPQDIGRVILNLINNAFFAVNEKRKSGIENYSPVVSITTKRLSDQVKLTVSDNGNGIPRKVQEKIFQPFFTTKPSGQGTGLGLSLSFDIIKAHGGKLTMETEEGKGSSFTIRLPLT